VVVANYKHTNNKTTCQMSFASTQWYAVAMTQSDCTANLLTLLCYYLLIFRNKAVYTMYVK